MENAVKRMISRLEGAAPGNPRYQPTPYLCRAPGPPGALRHACGRAGGSVRYVTQHVGGRKLAAPRAGGARARRAGGDVRGAGHGRPPGPHRLQPPHTASFTSADVALFAWGSEVWCRGGRLAERGQLSSHELAEFCALQVRAALPHP
eukprot:489834-Rhodomonas_salina.2